MTIAVGSPESGGTDAHEPASEGGALYTFDYNPPAAGPVNDDTFRINNLRPRFPHAARHWPCNQTSCFRPSRDDQVVIALRRTPELPIAVPYHWPDLVPLPAGIDRDWAQHAINLLQGDGRPARPIRTS